MKNVKAPPVVEIELSGKPAGAGDVILEIVPTSQSGRKPPPAVRGAPRAGHDPGNYGLAYFLYCACGCEAYSATPMRTCPQCHRPV